MLGTLAAPPKTYDRYRVKAGLQFRRQTEALPETLDKDYLVRVDVCGLCRSDLYCATSWAHDWQDIGHEFGGTIVAAKNSGGRFEVGDRVAVRNASACLECPSCVAGDLRGCQRLVVNMQGFSQYAQCDRRSLVAAYDLSDDLLGLVEPTNVVLDLLFSAELAPDDRVLIFGSGTLGLIAAYLASHYFKSAKVLLAGRQPAPALASKLGIHDYVTFDDLRRREPVRQFFGGWPDRILATTPPQTLPLALDVCAPGGRILTLGLDNEDAYAAGIDIQKLIFRRAQLQGVFAVPNLYFENAVEILRSTASPLGQLVTRRVAFEDLEEAFKQWNDRGHFDGKTLLVNRSRSGAAQ